MKNNENSLEEIISLRLFFVGLVAAVISIGVLAAMFFVAFDDQVHRDLKEDLNVYLSVYDETGVIPQIPDEKESLRVTLIAPDGAVLQDTGADLSALGNHRDRPEVQEALQGEIGSDVRSSATEGTSVYYYAVLTQNGNVLRVSQQAENLFSFYSDALVWLLVLLVLLMVVAAIISVATTKRVLVPIETMVGQIADDNETIEDPGYRELQPFVDQIRQQRERIANHMLTIEEEKNKLSAVLQNMSEGLLVLDADGRVIMANEAVIMMLSIKKVPEGQQLWRLTDNQQILSCTESAQKGYSRSVVIPVQNRELQIIANPVVENGEQVGVMCLLMDVTEREEIQHMRQEFTANVSHELKTPLTSISGYSEMIENGMAKPEDIPVFAGRIRTEAGRLIRLVGDILQLSKLDENAFSDLREPLNLMKIAEECVDTLTLTAQKRSVTLHVSGQPLIVEGERSMLTELVYNLCDNAIRYNKDGGEVRISSKGRTLTVEDTGIGIAEENIPHIFQRFYRVDKSRSRETGGTGLGLAIVKHIAGRHGALVTVTSTLDKGTSVAVTFPGDE